MIKYLIIGALTLSSLTAQKNSDCDPPINVNTGDVLEVAKPSANTYRYINLPRANFLIKRGGIANFNKLRGQKIQIIEVKTTEDCQTEQLI